MPSYVVTGANRGIGYGFVKHLASIEGNTVIGLARNKSAADERLAKDGIKNIHFLQADITDVKALEAAAAETAKITGGGLDILINNAAHVDRDGQFLTLLDDTPEGLEERLMTSFKANVVGVAHTINAFLPLIRKGQEKKVVTLSTGMADNDLTNEYDIEVGVPYSISKVATNGLVAKYNATLGKSEGILFFAISPGFVDTREGAPMSEQEMAGMQALAGKFAKYAPEWKGLITAQESVELQMQVIEKATVETMGGAFVSQHGTKQWL